MNKNEMLGLIKKYDDAYYNNDDPLVTDAAYDALRSTYVKLYGAEDLNYTPGDTDNVRFEQFSHPYPVISLAKVKATEPDKTKNFIKKLWPAKLQIKIDGLSIVAYPNPNGTAKYVTRGNGSIGEVLPRFIRKYNSIAVFIGKFQEYPVRGEVFMTKATFARINAERLVDGLELFKNPRNAAAGILRSKEESPYLKDLRFICYDVLGFTGNETEKLRYIDSCTLFDAVNQFAAETPEELAIEIPQLYERHKHGDVPIDGIVVKSDIQNSLEVFGSTGHHPNNAIAWKAEQERAQTKLLRIEWSLGRNKLTPVAILEPVDLDGSTISRASVHNVDWIKNKGLRIGNIVEIEKANEIIPQIVNIVTPGITEIEIPEVCPFCGNILTTSNGQLYCLNDLCDGKMINNVAHLAKKDALDIVGLSVKTIEKIVEKYCINGLEDIFFLSKDQLQKLDGFADRSAQKLYDAIQGARNVPLDRFIYACGILLIGRSASQDIAAKVCSYDALIKDIETGCKIITTIDGIGPSMIESLSSDRSLNQFKRLRGVVTPQEGKKKAVAKPAGDVLTFVITGTMSHPRSYYEGLIKNAGHKCSGSVSSKTSYLLAGAAAGSKLVTATKLKVSVISEDELEELLC